MNMEWHCKTKRLLYDGGLFETAHDELRKIDSESVDVIDLKLEIDHVP